MNSVASLPSPIFDMHPHEPAGVDIDISKSEELFFTKLCAPARMLVHDPAGYTDNCHDYLLFERFYFGSGRAEVGDIGFNVAPPRFHMIDMSLRYVLMKAGNLSRGICIRHVLLG
ncbi:MAG: hypothetical protein ACE37E_16805 [Hyphomicrobiales bacterium]